jgi:hypothetical protein
VIIKGGSRAAPKQLAYHLQRRDTNDRVEILELNALSDTLEGALYDWQTEAEATRSPNPRGLYHANIDPAEQYTLTPEQRARAVDLLEKELGLQGQPRVVILHEKYGREHLHVVWCRTDYEKCILKRDNNNFYAHERVSQQLELEFGHEAVPGKFAKRDREKQPEFPRAEFNHAEWQQSERSGLDPADRKKQIRAIHATAANGQEFKEALEGAGYVLAQGERGYLVVDQAGDHSLLSRNLLKMRRVDVDAFMADVPIDKLPTVDQAKAFQRNKALPAQQAQAPRETTAEPREMSQAERKEQIAGIRKSCDNAQAFKNALEGAGYVLAKGDKRGFVLVDGDGEVFSLSKHLADDIKGKEYKAFMAPVDMTALPNVEEAKAIQERRHQEAAAKAEKPPQERSKFLSDELAQKLEQPAAAPEKAQEQARPEDTRAERETPAKTEGIEASKFLKPVAPQQEIPAPTAPAVPAEPAARQPIDFTLYAPKEPETDQSWTQRTIAQEFQKADPEIERRNREKQRAAELRAKIEQKELRELRKEIWQEQVVDMQKHAEANSAQYREAEQTTKNQNASKMEDFDLQQQDARHAAQEQIQPEPKPFWLAALHRIIRDEDAEAKKEAERQEQLEILQARQAKERADYIKKLEQDRVRELEALRERHLREQAEREKKHDAELERHIREKKRALELQAEIEANDRAREESGWAEDFKKEQEYPWEAEPQTGQKLAEEFKKVDPLAERHQREKKRADELKAEIEAEEREKQLNRENEEGLGEGKG